MQGITIVGQYSIAFNEKTCLSLIEHDGKGLAGNGLKVNVTACVRRARDGDGLTWYEVRRRRHPLKANNLLTHHTLYKPGKVWGSIPPPRNTRLTTILLGRNRPPRLS